MLISKGLFSRYRKVGVWYASSESSRTVYSWNGTAWVPCFTYQSLAGGHMDGLEVILDCNNTPYVYVSDMTSDYIGQWKYDSDTASWKEENLFAYSDTSGSYVEGMGFGALNHIWVTGGSLYELGGGKLGEYLGGDFSVDDGGKCIPSNSTNITYTANYKNKASIDIEGVQVAHTGGTWGGTSLNWTIGDVASGETGSTTMTVPLSPPLVPNTTFSNQFTATSTTSGVPKQTATVTTLVCANTPPVAQCKDVELNLDSNGQAVLTSGQMNNGSSDPDGDPITFSLSKTNFSCSDIGTQHAVTLKVTDDGGLSDSCVSNVTVVDNTAPDVKTKNITVQLGSNGNASIAVDDIDSGSTDNCCIASRTIDKSGFTCSDLGENTVTLTVNDCNGNSSSATATVTVEDNIAPTNVQANAQSTITPPDAPISFTATADDNCSAAVEITDYSCYKVKKDGSQQSKMESCVVSLSGDTITISDSGGVGDNIVWTIVATDQSGNVTTAEGRVSVINPGGSNGKGNNGVGNGEDPQPRGNPPINDGPGTSPGNPGNRGKK